MPRIVTYKPIEATDGLLSTVYNVEVCAVGIEYPLASGPTTFTTEDLLQAVASQDDPNIQPPRVWLGHPDDDRFHIGRATPAGSAEPALGKIVNMRVEDNGMTLVGDITGCPTWLAKILASAFPSRSIEGFKDAVTASGRTWRMVVTDLALLGVTWPGVSSIEDLQALYSEEGPDDVVVKEGGDLTPVAASRLQGQVDIDDVRRAFIQEVEGGKFKELEWPWIRAILQDPNELIIDDDATGEIFRISYASDDKRKITFGELKQVRIEYVTASQQRDPSVRAVVTRVFLNGRKIAATYSSREESRAINDQEVISMTPEQLRASLGLPADATDDQVATRITELVIKAGAGDPGTPSPDQEPVKPEAPFHGPGSPPDPAPAKEAPTKANPEEETIKERHGTPESEPEPDAVAAALAKSGLVAVPASTWQGMQASVQALTSRHQADQVATDIELVAEAVRRGKILPSQREYYEARIKDPATQATFRHLLTASVANGGLMEGIIPVEARQFSVDDGGGQSTEAYPAGWFPEVAARAASAGPDPITLEGAT